MRKFHYYNWYLRQFSIGIYAADIPAAFAVLREVYPGVTSFSGGLFEVKNG